MTGKKRAQGIPMAGWQLLAIHAKSKQGINRQHFFQWLTDRVTIHAIEDDIFGVALRSTMLFQQRAKSHSLPDGGTNQVASHTIRDALKRYSARDRGQAGKLFISICSRSIDQSSEF